MTAKERIEELRDSAKEYIDISTEKTGGQTVGVMSYPTVVHNELLGIKISIHCHKSNYKNRELAVQLYNLAFDEIVK